MSRDPPDPTPASAAEGWLIEVSMPRVHAGRPAQTVFAVAIEHEAGAVDAVRRVLGGLHCRVDARCRLSSRALARLGVGPGEAKAI